MKTYAGIGSRETPSKIKSVIANFAIDIANKQYILHSGGADGADTWFEENTPTSQQKIFIPWDGFNGRWSRFGQHIITPECISDDATILARDAVDKYHQRPDKLGIGGTAMMQRNAHQVLGESMTDPVEFVVCWALGSQFDFSSGHQVIKTVRGGTGQAVRIAYAHEIPVFNLALRGHAAKLQEFISQL